MNILNRQKFVVKWHPLTHLLSLLSSVLPPPPLSDPGPVGLHSLLPSQLHVYSGEELQCPV